MSCSHPIFLRRFPLAENPFEQQETACQAVIQPFFIVFLLPRIPSGNRKLHVMQSFNLPSSFSSYRESLRATGNVMQSSNLPSSFSSSRESLRATGNCHAVTQSFFIVFLLPRIPSGNRKLSCSHPIFLHRFRLAENPFEQQETACHAVIQSFFIVFLLPGIPSGNRKLSCSHPIFLRRFLLAENPFGQQETECHAVIQSSFVVFGQQETVMLSSNLPSSFSSSRESLRATGNGMSCSHAIFLHRFPLAGNPFGQQETVVQSSNLPSSFSSCRESLRATGNCHAVTQSSFIVFLLPGIPSGNRKRHVMQSSNLPSSFSSCRESLRATGNCRLSALNNSEGE